MKTVCIDCRYISTVPSGIGEVVRGLIEFAPQLAPDLRFLLLRNPRHAEPLVQADNVDEVVVSQAANGPATMWWLPRVVDLRGVDLFHAPANIMPAGLPMPCVTTVHDVMRLTHPEWCRTGPWGQVERIFYGIGLRRALGHAAAIATVSRATADAVAAIAPGAMVRTHVTLSGVAPRFRPAPTSAGDRAGLGLAADRRYVLCVGQYAPYKNHEGAVRAFAGAFGNASDIDLVFVQRLGGRAQGLLDLAANLGLGPRVHFLSTVPADRLVALYANALALLHPSFCEGFGNPIAEAMACGCPVVTSNLSAMPEVTAGAARLADPRDLQAMAAQLVAVVEQPDRTAELRAKGIERAAGLSWQAFAAANLAIYRDVLG